ncbi:MAG: hypothetical protein ACKOB3_04800 [Holophagaceae bacterium]
MINPHTHKLGDLVDFAERIQITEERYGVIPGSVLKGSAVKPRPESGTSGSSNGQPASGVAKRSESYERKHTNNKDCLIHGDNCGHGSHKCKVLMSHATKYREAWNSKPRDKYPAAKKKQNYKSKDSNERTYTRNELQAAIKRATQHMESLNIEATDDADMDDFDDSRELDKFMEEAFNRK